MSGRTRTFRKIAVNKPAAFGRVSSTHTELDVSCKHAVTSTGCVFLYYAEEQPCNKREAN